MKPLSLLAGCLLLTGVVSAVSLRSPGIRSEIVGFAVAGDANEDDMRVRPGYRFRLLGSTTEKGV